jgi:hypothetical protein
MMIMYTDTSPNKPVSSAVEHRKLRDWRYSGGGRSRVVVWCSHYGRLQTDHMTYGFLHERDFASHDTDRGEQS